MCRPTSFSSVRKPNSTTPKYDYAGSRFNPTGQLSNCQRLGNGELVDLIIYDGLQDPYSKRHKGEITEDWIADNGFSREDQDSYAVRSYRLSQAAVENETFVDEIVPVVKKTRKGDITISADEKPFRSDIDKLPGVRPVFSKTGTTTAGSASTISDGAGLAMLASGDAVKQYDLQPIARIVASATNSIHPNLFAEAPVGAIQKCCERAELQLDDIGLFEINEAFLSVPLAAIKQLNLDSERVNVNSGAVSIGHPIGASGGRLVATLLREMKVRNEKYGLATLCIGGGEAVAAIFNEFSKIKAFNGEAERGRKKRSLEPYQQTIS